MPVDSSAAYIPLDGSSRSGCWGQRSTLERSFIFVIAFLAIIAITLGIALVYKKCDDSHVTTLAPNVTTPSPNVTTIHPNVTTIHPNPSPNITTPHPNITTIHPTHSPNITTPHANITTIHTTHSPNITTPHANITTINPTHSPNATTVHPNGTRPEPSTTDGTIAHPKPKTIKLTAVPTTLDFQQKPNEDNLTKGAIIDEPKS